MKTYLKDIMNNSKNLIRGKFNYHLNLFKNVLNRFFPDIKEARKYQWKVVITIVIKITDSPNWIRNKKPTINPINDDDKCFQNGAAVTLNHEKMGRNSQIITKTGAKRGRNDCGEQRHWISCTPWNTPYSQCNMIASQASCAGPDSSKRQWHGRRALALENQLVPDRWSRRDLF